MNTEDQELDVAVEAIGEEADIESLYEKYKKESAKTTEAKHKKEYKKKKEDIEVDVDQHDEMDDELEELARLGKDSWDQVEQELTKNHGWFTHKEDGVHHGQVNDKNVEIEYNSRSNEVSYKITKRGRFVDSGTFDAKRMSASEIHSEISDIVKSLQESKKEPIEEPEADEQPAAEPVPTPTTKAGMINAMYKELNSMKKDDVEKAYHGLMGGEIEQDLEQKPQVDMEEAFEKLFEQSDIDENFKQEIETLFESKVNERVEERVEEISKNFESAIAETEEQLTENLDKYLDFVVENWMEENKVAVENTIRTEIAENFMEELKGLFENHYIDVPESKLDLVEELTNKIESLEEELNESIEQSISLKESLANSEREYILSEQLENLSRIDADKVRKLAQRVVFEDKESFVQEIETIKNFLNEQHVVTKSNNDDIETLEENADTLYQTNPKMQKYLDSITKSV